MASVSHGSRLANVLECSTTYIYVDEINSIVLLEVLKSGLQAAPILVN